MCKGSVRYIKSRGGGIQTLNRHSSGGKVCKALAGFTAKAKYS